MGNLALIILNAVTFVLNIGPVYSQVAQGNANSSVICMSIWVMITSLNNVINFTVWYSDADIRIPGFCDISVKLIIGAQIARPAACMCIARFLAAVVSPRATAITRQHRRDRAIFDYTMCIGVPALAMACHILFQPERFLILSGVGCQPTVLMSWPTLLVLFIWPPIFSLAGALYAVYVVYRIVKHRRDFSRIVAGAHSALTASRFARLTAFSVLYVTFGFPTSIVYPIIQGRLSGDYLDYSFTYLHSIWKMNPILQDYTPKAAGFRTWADVIIAGLYFACFGLGAESLVQYRKAASMLGFGCWGNRSRGLKAEKSEDGVRMTRRWGSTTEAEHTDARSPTNSPNYGGPFHVKYEEAGRPAGVSRGVKVVVEREEDIV